MALKASTFSRKTALGRKPGNETGTEYSPKNSNGLWTKSLQRFMHKRNEGASGN